MKIVVGTSELFWSVKYVYYSGYERYKRRRTIKVRSRLQKKNVQRSVMF